MRKFIKRAAFPSAIVSALLLVACGSSNSSVPINLSPDAKAGRELAIATGCASCHGSNGQGRVGPKFIGLADSQVLLSDDTTVTADDTYLYESIKNPDAKRRRGATSRMPSFNLSDAQIASIISYIRALKG